MSTVALWWSAEAAAPAVEPKAKLGLFQRLIKAREAEARHRVHAFLAAQTDQHLQDLGFSAEDIQTMRQGQFRFRAR